MMHALHHIVAVEPDDRQLLDAVRLAEAMWDESPTYREMDKSIDTMIEFAYNCRADIDTFLNVAVDTTTRTVCGFLVGGYSHYGFHDSMFAYDRLVYVTPTARGGSSIIALVNAFEAWCKSRGISAIMLGITTGVHTRATERLYNRLGYETIGTLTMRRID